MTGLDLDAIRAHAGDQPDVLALIAEITRLRAFLERMWDQHMRFGVAGQDDVKMACADWCYRCRLDRAEAEAARLREILSADRRPFESESMTLADLLHELARCGLGLADNNGMAVARRVLAAGYRRVDERKGD